MIKDNFVFFKARRLTGSFLVLNDKRIRRKKEGVAVHMSRMVEGGGVFDVYVW